MDAEVKRQIQAEARANRLDDVAVAWAVVVREAGGEMPEDRLRAGSRVSTVTLRPPLRRCKHHFAVLLARGEG